MGSLFEDDFGEDESPKDNTQITTTLLYYSEEELKEVKRLAKAAMKRHMSDYMNKGNMSDLFLIFLRADEKSNPQT